VSAATHAPSTVRFHAVIKGDTRTVQIEAAARGLNLRDASDSRAGWTVVAVDAELTALQAWLAQDLGWPDGVPYGPGALLWFDAEDDR
jgi:hypothetical protein